MEIRNNIERDENEINEIVDKFFDLFTNVDNKMPDVHKVKEMFLNQGLLINNSFQEPAIYNLDSFIAPRQAMLTNGTLTNFREKEVSQTTKVFRNIATRNCSYEKSGILNGEPFKGSGKKLMHFIKIENKWWMSSVVWSDDT